MSAALALGLAGMARPNEPLRQAPREATIPVSQGLLGQQSAGLSYRYINLDDRTHADNVGLVLNEPLSAGLDGFCNYDYTKTGVIVGGRLEEHVIMAGLRAYRNSYVWGQPFVEAAAGYAWQRFGAADDDSFIWAVAVGAEFQLAPAFSLTPSFEYAEAPRFGGNGTFAYGVKANYWIDSQWAVMAAIDRDDDRNIAFTIGTNFRY